MAHLKESWPDLWAELERLDNVEGRVTKGFKYGETFSPRSPGAWSSGSGTATWWNSN